MSIDTSKINRDMQIACTCMGKTWFSTAGKMIDDNFPEVMMGFLADEGTAEIMIRRSGTAFVIEQYTKMDGRIAEMFKMMGNLKGM